MYVNVAIRTTVPIPLQRPLTLLIMRLSAHKSRFEHSIQRNRRNFFKIYRNLPEARI